MQQLLHRRSEEPWALPIDGNRQQEAPPESKLATVSYAFAAGLSATLLGALVSIVVPGRGFLLVWAVVTLVSSIAAGWEAERMRSAVRRRLAHLVRTR